jgi:YfiH family protein
MELLTSPLLRSSHAFPTRAGGVSSGVFASLNTSVSVGDSSAAVAANLERLARALRVEPGGVATASQVHGDVVLEAEAGGARGEADALWTRRPGVAVGVRTADCLPILLEDAERGLVAAVHAGWRGVVSEIVVRAVEQLERAGARRDALRVAIGPAIQRCCFEVDGDLPTRFERAFGAEVVAEVPGKPKRHVDLALAAQRSLERAGVRREFIDRLPHCTVCDGRFFSHRRDRGQTGRHLSLIVCAGAAGL